MPVKPIGQDLYLLLEAEIRTPKRRLLIDAFLPPPEAIPSALEPPAAPAPEKAPQGASLKTILARAVQEPGDADEEPAAAPPPRRRARRDAPAAQKSLEEEIAEFMSRSGGALAPDPDPDP